MCVWQDGQDINCWCSKVVRRKKEYHFNFSFNKEELGNCKASLNIKVVLNCAINVVIAVFCRSLKLQESITFYSIDLKLLYCSQVL